MISSHKTYIDTHTQVVLVSFPHILFFITKTLTINIIYLPIPNVIYLDLINK